MDNRLKELLQQLGNNINKSLTESEEICNNIASIRNAGYDVFLVVEATIGFGKKSSEQKKRIADEAPEVESHMSQISLTAQDHAFLKALKITVQE